MSEAIAIQKREESVSIKGLESALLDADLGKMPEAQRIQYYTRVCDSLGLNPLTQPFEYIRLNGKLVLYARRSCTEQLRKMQGISVKITSRETTNGIYVVTAQAETPTGRVDESIGAVPIEGLKGENLSNALMKAETKAKRRVTLAICGLAFLDESEADSIAGAVRGEPKEARPVRTLDSVAAEGERERPLAAPSNTSAGQETARSSSTERNGSAPTASAAPTAEPTTAPTTTATADGEILDAKAWRARLEALAEEMMQGGVLFEQEDEYGMPIPPFDEPVFSAKSKNYAGKPYSAAPVGLLRKMAQDERFASQSSAERIWVLALIARHELAKQTT